MKTTWLFRPHSFLAATLVAPVATLLLCTAPSALAAGPYYWDCNNGTTGFGTAQGTMSGATVPTANYGWSLSSTGITTISPGSGVNPGTGSNVFFGTATDGLGSGTISVGTQNIGDITFGSASGAIILSGGQINGPAAFSITVNNTQDTITSVLAGAANNVTKAGTGTLTLSGANIYAGSTIISAGTLQLGAAGVLPDGIGKGNVSVTGTLDLNTYSETINGLSGAGVVDTVAGGTPTLTVGGNDQTSAFSGVIKNTAGTLALTKIGSGALTLSGTNTYSGNTAVNAGKLVVNGSIGASAVSVNNAGTILATYTAASFGSTLAINAGAILAVGDAANTATATATVTGASTFADTSIFSWDIDADGTAYDKLVAASLVDGGDTGGAVLRIVASDALVTANFWNTTKTWTDIFTTDGSAAIADWANIFTTVNVVNSSFGTITPVGGSFSASGNTLTWTAVPEPTSALAVILLGAGLLRRRRSGV